jgi:hypothetical protein
MRWAAPGADFALINAGILRSDLAPGNITVGDVLSVVPFSNSLVVMDLTGAALHAIIGQGTWGYEGAESKGFPTVAGLEYTINLSQRSMDWGRISRMRRLDRDGRYIGDVKDNTLYQCVVTNFVATGGDGYTLLMGLTASRSIDEVANALVGFLRDCGNIDENAPFLKSGAIHAQGVPQIAPPVTATPAPVDKTETVVVAHTFNALNAQFNMQSDIWKPFADYTVRAYKYIAKDLDFLRSIAPHVSSYICANGIVISTASACECVANGSSLADSDILHVGDDLPDPALPDHVGDDLPDPALTDYQGLIVGSIALWISVVLLVVSVIFFR